ncbi:MAG TPA: general secretion pathway protein GspB [Steroidobacteraceae bacterium]|nr:general secretion pathway protein GspB [Steroidobacteraceae bacterium]
MSFILDALRKSEHARQKQSGPGFAEVPVVVTRPRTNRWATAAVALLVVNLLAVGLLLLRRANQQHAAPAAATAPAAPAAATESASQPLAASARTPEATAAGSGGPTLAPPVARLDTSRPPRGSDAGRNPLAEEVGEGAPGLDPALAEAAASVPAGPPAVTREPSAPARRGSVVYAPLPESADLPSTPPSAAAASAPVAPGAGELPTADELTARGGLPELHLDLHVYSTVPQQRFIFVNSRKYREGDAMQEGPLVEQITARGAVLNYRGSRFELSND